MKIALSSYCYALSGRKTAHTFAESALYYALSGRKTAHTFAESALEIDRFAIFCQIAIAFHRIRVRLDDFRSLILA